MKLYILKRENNGLYAVYVDGIKVKNAIFASVEDFQAELEVLGLSGQVVVGN